MRNDPNEVALRVTAWSLYIGLCINGLTHATIGWQSILSWIYDHETLVAAILALSSAIVAAFLLNAQIQQVAKQESDRRKNRRDGTRSILPVSLSEIVKYADESAKAARTLLDQCVDNALPIEVAEIPLLPALPSTAMLSLRELIELADEQEVALIAQIPTIIQYQYSRISGVIDELKNPPSHRTITVSLNLEAYILDAAEVRARAESLFTFARRQADTVDVRITWGAVRSALFLMRIYEEDYPELYKLLMLRAGNDLSNLVRQI